MALPRISHKLAILTAIALATSAAAKNLPHFNEIPMTPKYQALYRQFRDQVILGGQCEAWVRAMDPAHPSMADANEALDACWLDWLAPRL